ncbi:MAG: hypothetical protein ABSD68_02930 [Candidatus Micrarchaeales archaeon]|jgi:hypothetical protein
MLENDIENRFYSYAFYVLAAAMLLASALSHNIILLLMAVLFIPASAIYMHSGHVLNNFLLGRGKIIEIYNKYKVSENLSSAVKKVGNSYFSVSCAILKKVSGERNGELISSLISNTDFPFEFSIGLRSVNKEKILDGLETKRRFKEIEIARADPKKYDKTNCLRRELEIIESDIKSIRSQKPLALSLKLKTFASSSDESDAATETSQNIERLASSFSSSLGFEHEILKGERLMDELCLERQVQ